MNEKRCACGLYEAVCSAHGPSAPKVNIPSTNTCDWCHSTDDVQDSDGEALCVDCRNAVICAYFNALLGDWKVNEDGTVQ